MYYFCYSTKLMHMTFSKDQIQILSDCQKTMTLREMENITGISRYLIKSFFNQRGKEIIVGKRHAPIVKRKEPIPETPPLIRPTSTYSNKKFIYPEIEAIK